MIRFTVLSNGFAGRDDQAGLQVICDRSSPGAVRVYFERGIAHIPAATRRRGPGRRVPEALVRVIPPAPSSARVTAAASATEQAAGGGRTATWRTTRHAKGRSHRCRHALQHTLPVPPRQ